MKSSNFEKTVEDAAGRLKNGQHEAAARLYKQATTIDFVEGLDSWEEYYDARIHLSTALKDGQQFVPGRAILEKVLQHMESKEIDERLPSRRNVMKFKASATHNLGKLELAFSYQFKPAEEYVSYRKSLNTAHQHFLAAFVMVVEMLAKWTERGLEANQWWVEEYFKIKSNYLQVLFQEGEQFADRSCFQAILADVQRAKRFFRLCPSDKGEIHLYRCFYSKSVALRQLGREEESYRLLLEDYQFERDHNQLVDAEKSRRELLRHCLDHNLMSQARKYVVSKEERDILVDIHNRRERMRAHFAQSAEVLRNFTKQFYLQLLDDLDSQMNQYAFDYRSLQKYLQQALEVYKENPAVRGLFFSSLAECSYRLKDYAKAERMINEALRLPSSDEIERRDCEIMQLRVRSKLPAFKATVVQRYNDMARQLNTRLKRERSEDVSGWLETQKTVLIEVYQQFNKHELKAKDPVNYSFAIPQENRLIAILEKAKTKPQQAQKGESKEGEERVMGEDGEAPNRQKRQIFNPEEQYSRRCTQLGLPERPEVKQALGKGTFSINPFQDTFNMSPQELQLLLPLLKTDSLDLRNHMAGNDALEAIAHPALVKCFKLSGVNAPSNKAILRAVSKMSGLAYLSFVHFPAVQHRAFDLLDKAQLRNGEQSGDAEPRSLIHTVLLLKYFPGSQFDPSCLRVLKLKFCNLCDDHLRELDFQQYPNLQEVGLSHNLLQGRHLPPLMVLKKISRVNLSDNPLCSLALEGWKHRLLENNFYLRRLKLRNVEFSCQLASELSFVLQRTKAIDVSEGKSLGHLITSAWNNYLDGKCLDALEEWAMTGVDLDSLKLQQLMGLLGSCPSLQRADLRFCKHSYNIQAAIDQLQGEQKMNILLSSADYNPEVTHFDLPSTDRRH